MGRHLLRHLLRDRSRPVGSSAARSAEERKGASYSSLCERYIFVPFAVETSGVLGPAASGLLKELGQRLTARTRDKREGAWLSQRVSLAVARERRLRARHSRV